MEKCDAEVFKHGQSLVALNARSMPAEEWVQEVAKRSGQRVDWHYSGGVAHVLVLGDHAKALEAAQAMPPCDGVRVLRWFGPQDGGLYRSGVTNAPEGAIAGAGSL